MSQNFANKTNKLHRLNNFNPDKIRRVEAKDGRNLITRLWPINLSVLKANNIPYVDFLKIPRPIFFSSIIMNLLGLALPLLILQVYDRIIPNNSIHTLKFLVVGFITVMVLEFLLRISRAYVMGWAASKFEMKACQEAISSLLHAPLFEVAKDKPQMHLERLNAMTRLADFYGGPNSMLLVDLPFVIVFLTVLFLIGGSLVLLPIGILLVFGIMTLKYGRLLRERLEERDFQDTKTYDFIAECMRGILTLKGFAMEPLMLRRFERLQVSRARINYSTISSSANAHSFSSILGNITIISIVTVGGMKVVSGELSIGTLAACTLLAGRTIQPVIRFASLWGEFQKLEKALIEASDIYNLPYLQAYPKHDSSGSAPHLRIENLVLEVDGKKIFGPVSLHVKQCEFIGLTGQDGSGKTSLLKCITGLVPPTSGNIYYNDIPIDNYRAGNPRSVVMVGLTSTVLDGTILDNFTLFGSGPNIDEVRWAARMTGVDADINSLPHGYDTLVGDGAHEALPQGLMRRIIITRALALNPKALILDEPQMFLDSASDKKLMACLYALRSQTTMIISTQRPSYFQLVDRLYRMENGLLRDAGLSATNEPGSGAIEKKTA